MKSQVPEKVGYTMEQKEDAILATIKKRKMRPYLLERLKRSREEKEQEEDSLLEEVAKELRRKKK